MKITKFLHLEETCPKCNNTIMLEEESCCDGLLYYVFCETCHCKGAGAFGEKTALANFHKKLARKEKLALRKPEKILTDIRDYLVSWRDNNAIDYSAERWIDETALPDLTEYAEKLGVEL